MRGQSLAGVQAMQAWRANPTILGECSYCLGPATTTDHIVPRSQDGSDDPENRTPACLPCNQSKGQRTPEQWLSDGLVGSKPKPPPDHKWLRAFLAGTVSRRWP